VAFWHTIKRYADAKEVHEILKKFGKYPEEEEEKRGNPNSLSQSTEMPANIELKSKVMPIIPGVRKAT
jgi:hypothetical protein